MTDIAGSISGLRFYKAAANTGTHVASLWDANGTLLAQSTFASESTSGWQQVSFPTPVAVTANHLYIASYHTPTGHVADDKWFSTLPPEFFEPTGFDAAPLHMVSGAGPSGPNDVYAISSTSTFPTQASLDENYWVDVVFNSS